MKKKNGKSCSLVLGKKGPLSPNRNKCALRRTFSLTPHNDRESKLFSGLIQRLPQHIWKSEWLIWSWSSQWWSQQDISIQTCLHEQTMIRILEIHKLIKVTIYIYYMNYKSVLRTLIWPFAVPKTVTFAKSARLWDQKMALRVAKSKF